MKLKHQIRQVEDAICSAANITREELYGRSRKQELADARAAVWYILNKRLACPFALIGKYYARDHTTVLRAVERAAQCEISTVALAVIEKHTPEVLRKHVKSGPLTVDTWKY